jgi:hypothetical protein
MPTNSSPPSFDWEERELVNRWRPTTFVPLGESTLTYPDGTGT